MLKFYTEKYPTLQSIPANYHLGLEKLITQQYISPISFERLSTFNYCLSNKHEYSFYLIFSQDQLDPMAFIPIQIKRIYPKGRFFKKIKNNRILYQFFSYLFQIPFFSSFTKRKWDILSTVFMGPAQEKIGPIFHPNFFLESLSVLKKLLLDMKKFSDIDQVNLYLDTNYYKESSHYWDSNLNVYQLEQQIVQRKYKSYYEYCKNLTHQEKKSYYLYQDFLTQKNYISFSDINKVYHYFYIENVHKDNSNLFFDFPLFKYLDHLKQYPHNIQETKFIFFEDAGFISACIIFIKAKDNSANYFCNIQIIDETRITNIFKSYLDYNFLLYLSMKIFYEDFIGNKLIYIGSTDISTLNAKTLLVNTSFEQANL